MTTSWQRWIEAAACSVCLSCASGTSGTLERSARHSRLASSVVTAAELTGEERQETLLHALMRVRPQFLVSRGSSSVVTIDGAPVVELAILATVRLESVREVRFFRAPSPHDCCRNVLEVRLGAAR